MERISKLVQHLSPSTGTSASLSSSHDDHHHAAGGNGAATHHSHMDHTHPHAHLHPHMLAHLSQSDADSRAHGHSGAAHHTASASEEDLGGIEVPKCPQISEREAEEIALNCFGIASVKTRSLGSNQEANYK
jgi:hypothetical protein